MRKLGNSQSIIAPAFPSQRREESGEEERMHQEPYSENGLKLFGVRIMCDRGGGKKAAEEGMEDVTRKKRSTANLVAYSSLPATESGADGNVYLCDGGLFQTSRRRHESERKRGLPWTEAEHRAFLAGLQMLGKGDWKGISRNFVTTRTPTQVASHAQKYFLRQINRNEKKCRSSVFDMVISDPSPAPPLSLKRPYEVTEEINHQLQDSYLAKSPAFIPTQATSEGPEPSLALPLIKDSREAARIHNVNHMAGGISGNSKDQIGPTILLLSPLNISDQTLFPSCQANSAACAPDFVKVPFSPSIELHSYCPALSTAALPTLESKDLELSSARP